jgi:RNA polymerase primary sigma factor
VDGARAVREQQIDFESLTIKRKLNMKRTTEINEANFQTERNLPTRSKLPRVRLTSSRRRGRSRAVEPPEGVTAAASRNESSLDALETSEPARSESASGNMLHLYLREIGQVKLLTPAEEIALAKRIKRGDKAAREQMIKANLRLVVKIARDYEDLGLPLLDLINEGNIGLMKGVERFDPKKGAKLSTYASWWIKQAIKRALANQSKTIRLPVHVVDKVAHIRRAETQLREAFDREPTDEEVAEHLDLDARRVRQYREASRAPLALDAPIGDDDSSVVSEIVADTNAAAPFDRLVRETDTALLQEALATLDERESKILAMRFGLDDGEEQTLEQVGEHFGVTRERIRQIQEEALKKMRVKIEKQDRGKGQDKELAVAA